MIATKVRELSIFGAAARGELRGDSDLDLLIDFQPDARIGLLEFGALTEELSVLAGKRVDLAIKRALKPRIRAEVLAEAITCPDVNLQLFRTLASAD